MLLNQYLENTSTLCVSFYFHIQINFLNNCPMIIIALLFIFIFLVFEIFQFFLEFQSHVHRFDAE